MERRIRRVAVLWLCAATVLPLYAQAQPPAEGPPPAGSPAGEVFPVRIVELSGSGEEIGLSHGEALGGVIRALQARYMKAYFTSEAVRFLALATATAFEDKLSPEHRAEVAALGRRSGVEARQMMLAQCFLDLSTMVACSTVTLPADAAPDGVARFGRNLDFFSFGIADKQTAVFIYRPAGAYQFMAVGWPGMVGVLSGMNEHGLTLANMEVPRLPRLPQAMPYTLLYRTVLERCRTVDEAVELLENTPRQTANNLMLMDADGVRAVVEIRPDRVTVRRGESGEALISTNHQRGQDGDTAGECDRYDRLHELSARDFGTIDRGRVQEMLGKVAQGKRTLQSMVFEPSERVVYLAAGLRAASRPFHRLDLKPYFARGGDVQVTEEIGPGAAGEGEGVR